MTDSTPFDGEFLRAVLDAEPEPPARFDQDRLYCDGTHAGAVEVGPAPLAAWRDGYKRGARVAALIVAERATPMPSDDLVSAVRSTVEALERSDAPHQIIAKNGPTHVRLRAALDAIAAAQPPTGPEIPDWVKSWHVVPNGEHGPGFTVYTNPDTFGDDHTFDTWGYHPTDPMKALQAAIAATGEGE